MKPRTQLILAFALLGLSLAGAATQALLQWRGGEEIHVQTDRTPLAVPQKREAQKKPVPVNAVPVDAVPIDAVPVETAGPPQGVVPAQDVTPLQPARP